MVCASKKERVDIREVLLHILNGMCPHSTGQTHINQKDGENNYANAKTAHVEFIIFGIHAKRQMKSLNTSVIKVKP